jgi:hypothetical protein
MTDHRPNGPGSLGYAYDPNGNRSAEIRNASNLPYVHSLLAALAVGQQRAGRRFPGGHPQAPRQARGLRHSSTRGDGGAWRLACLPVVLRALGMDIAGMAEAIRGQEQENRELFRVHVCLLRFAGTRRTP